MRRARRARPGGEELLQSCNNRLSQRGGCRQAGELHPPMVSEVAAPLAAVSAPCGRGAAEKLGLRDGTDTCDFLLLGFR